jgi:hypothetical protein
MVENQKFPLPPEIDEILDRLPPQVTLNVPSDVLVHWFSPASADGDMDEVTLARAENYARSCGCRFAYHASIREGVFYKLVNHRSKRRCRGWPKARPRRAWDLMRCSGTGTFSTGASLSRLCRERSR